MELSRYKTVQSLAHPMSTLIASSGNQAYIDALLAADASATDTTIDVSKVPAGAIANGFFVVIDPWTVQCEVRKVTGISGNTLTIAALTYAHSLDDGVIYTPDPTLNVKWFGATTASAAAAVSGIERALANITELGGGQILFTELYPINDFITLVSDVDLIGLGYSTGIDGDGITYSGSNGYFEGTDLQNITIQNMRFAGDGENTHISLHSTDNIKIVNNWFIDDAGGTQNIAAIRIQYSAGVDAENSVNIDIGGNFFSVYSNAILTQGRQTGPSQIKYLNIHDNIIQGAVAGATQTYGVIKIDVHSYFYTVSNNIIDGDGNISDAINIQEDAYNGVVSGNVIYDCLRNGIRIEDGGGNQPVERLQISDNMITTVTGGTNPTAINLNPSSATFEDILIADNLIRNCDYGIRENVGSTNNLVIQGNQVLDCDFQAIYIRSDDVVVKDNTVDGAATYASLYINASADGTIARGNVFEQADGSGNYINDNGTNTLRVHNINGGDPDLNWEDWEDYSATSTITGWTSYTFKEIFYTKFPNGIVKIQYRLVGTSNSTSTSFTLPFNADTSVSIVAHKPGLAKDNGTALNGAAFGSINTASAPGTVTFYTDESASAWTNSGTKNVTGQFYYMAA